MTAFRSRLAGPGAFVLAGIAFLLYPVLRPWEDETTVAGAAAAMSSVYWIASHLFAVAGFVLLVLGLLALRDRLRPTPGAGLAGAGLIAAWIGVGLVLPYYGAEAFGLHAIATHDADASMLDTVDAFRYQGSAVSMFAIGLILMAVGGVLAAVAIARSAVMDRWTGVAMAAGLVLFLPQFFLPAPVRIAHGVLLAAGCMWIGYRLSRTPDRADAVG